MQIFQKYWQKWSLKFQSVVKTSKPMFMTQNLKFPTARDLKNISQKIISRKNDFPQNNSFLTAIWHIHTSTKMGFPGNQPKMAQLYGPLTFSKMVVRGWYMPHFDRRDLLNSKKQVWGWFPQLARPLWTDLRNFPIFSEISPGQPISKKVIFLTAESEKMIEN